MPRRPPVIAVAVALVVVGLVVAWMGQRAEAVTSGQPALTWRLSPASNTVTIRLTAGQGPLGRQDLARSRLTVAEPGTRHLRTVDPDGRTVRVPVPPGRQTQLAVQVRGPQPYRRTLTVAVPPALRVTAVRAAFQRVAGIGVRPPSPPGTRAALRHRQDQLPGGVAGGGRQEP